MKKPPLAIYSALTITCLMPLSSYAEYVKINDDLSIHYETSGSGKQTILFVPGWTMSSAVFEKQFEHYRNSKEYRVISYDPRSQGLTTHSASGNNYEQHGRDLKTFIDKLELKDVVLAGWSNGVYDVLSYVHQYGASNLKSLILIDGPPKCSAPDNTKEWAWFRNDDADKAREYFTMGALRDRQKLNEEFAKWMVKDPTEAYLKWAMNISNQTPDEVAALTNKTCTYMNFSEDAKSLNGKMPLLYVVREEWAPLAKDWVIQNTPKSDFKVLGKHMMF